MDIMSWDEGKYEDHLNGLTKWLVGFAGSICFKRFIGLEGFIEFIGFIGFMEPFGLIPDVQGSQGI